MSTETATENEPTVMDAIASIRNEADHLLDFASGVRNEVQVNPLDVANWNLMVTDLRRVVSRANTIIWNINEREKYAATVASVATNTEGKVPDVGN